MSGCPVPVSDFDHHDTDLSSGARRAQHAELRGACVDAYTDFQLARGYDRARTVAQKNDR